MDNFSKQYKNRTRSPGTGKQSKPDKRWTILFIGKHGKTIAVDRFKGMVLLTCLILCISLATTAGLLYFSFNIRQENQQLRSDFQKLKAQIKTIRYEKDVLMTKLVLAESQTSKSPAATEPKPAESASSQKDVIGFQDSKQPDRPERIPKKLPAEKNDEPPAVEAKAESGPSIAVEDFKISPKVDEKLLRVQFKIKNTSSNSQRVSGHAIVVLKGEQLPQHKWLAMPRIALSNGKPTGKQRGYTFGINYFKTMRFKTMLPKSPEIYQKAALFIFSGGGDLLLEQEFPVNLSTTSPAGAPRSSSTTASGISQKSPPDSIGRPPAASSAQSPTTHTVIQSATSSPAAPSSDDSQSTLKNSTNQ